MTKKSKLPIKRLKKAGFKEAAYDPRNAPGAPPDDLIRSSEALFAAVKDGKAEIEARMLEVSREKSGKFNFRYRKLNSGTAFKDYSGMAKRKWNGIRAKESGDSFSTDSDLNFSNTVGNDFVPLLSGPFNKQLYLQDYLRMHSQAFYAFHHDPLARASVRMQRDFTLGRGFRVSSKSDKAMAWWKLFEEVNKLQQRMSSIAYELSIYGEIFIWKLPGNATNISFGNAPEQKPNVGLVPRIRMIDPSVIWEIITYPEDIERVLAYVWSAPTQYQMYTGQDAGKSVPSSKFIYQQIPADQIMHFKINCVSNEKRGRSDLFPILGYLKRLRDAVNYEIIKQQKNSAWGIDTTVDGNQADIDTYADAAEDEGTFAPAGSEFVHSKKVERKYLANSGTTSGASNAFEWCLSMIASGYGWPISYYGTHLSGGHTRAGAIVATEPAAKMIEYRQLTYEDIVRSLWRWFINEQCGASDQECKEAECEITFPTVVEQDRSTKLKDLALAQEMKWLEPSYAAETANKELGRTDFEYDDIQKAIKDEAASAIDTAAGRGPPAPGGIGNVFPLSSPALASKDPAPKPSALTGDEKRKVSMSNG